MSEIFNLSIPRLARTDASTPTRRRQMTPPSPRSRSTFPTRHWPICSAAWPQTAWPAKSPAPAGATVRASAYVTGMHRPAAQRLRLARPGSRDQSPSAIHHRDRRPDHPLPAREIAPRPMPPRCCCCMAGRARSSSSSTSSALTDRWRMAAGCRPSTSSSLAARLRLFGPDQEAGWNDERIAKACSS